MFRGALRTAAFSGTDGFGMPAPGNGHILAGSASLPAAGAPAADGATPPPLERPGLAEMAYNELLDAIVGARLRPGAKLVPETLAAQLGVSAMPVKLALARLTGEGLVV